MKMGVFGQTLKALERKSQVEISKKVVTALLPDMASEY